MEEKPHVVAIVGATASGKTSVSIEVALACGGEVVSADSRQVYRGLDIGSAKVTTAEMRGVPHHLLDVVDPHTVYTGAQYVHDAHIALTDIIARHKTPIVAGGTFFYIQLLRGAMSSAPAAPNPTLRAELELLDLVTLGHRLHTLAPQHATGDRMQNKRRLIRTIEIITTLGHLPEVTPQNSPYTWHLYGIDISLEMLTPRIETRIKERIELGLFEEIQQLHADGLSWQRLEDFGLEYRYGSYFLQGKITQDTFVTELTTKTRQFAKRQYTWLKQVPDITWIPFPANPEVIITDMQRW